MTLKVPYFEFTLLLAFLMSIVAFSIDAILPALGLIGESFVINQDNQVQWIITSIFIGSTLGQLISGLLSDAIGRLKVLYLGLVIYFVGTSLCYFADRFDLFLFGRFVQGIGISAPFVSAIAMVRDRYHGVQMAKTMSFIMMIYMIVPAIAPAVGQILVHYFNWHAIFIVYFFYALFIGLWAFVRLEESLEPKNRNKIHWSAFSKGFATVFSHRTSFCYLICTGLSFGCFIGYLSNSQQIFMQLYHKSGKEFSLCFAILAIVMAIASFINTKIVARFGMRKICIYGFLSVSSISCIFLVIPSINAFVSFELFMFYITSILLLFGILFGNLNAIALEPMGHIAGMASAIVGASSSILALILATIIGQLYNETLVPLTLAFMIISAVGFIIASYEQKNLTPQPSI